MVVPRIGISANFFHADPERAVFRHKTLQYVEERMALAIFSAGAVPVMLPDLKSPAALAAVMGLVDGLVLSGGADVSPQTYGQEPIEERWRGDPIRDAYECQLVRLAEQQRLPVLGICRGIQLVNVALGGTLWQDINTQVADTLVHRDWHRYDDNGHDVRLDPDSWVAQVYGGRTSLAVNSIHHQAIATLAPGLRATAWAPDGIVEAAQSTDPERFIVAVQWHPEWLETERVATDGPDAGRAAGAPIFDAFIAECARRI